MITVLRDKFKAHASRVLMGILTFFLIMGLLDFGISKRPGAGDNSPWVFRINGQEVLESTLTRNIIKQEQNIAALREQYGAYAQEFIRTLNVKKLAAEEVKRDTILDQLATSIPIYIGQTYIEQKINNPQFMYQSGLAEILPYGSYTREGLDLARLRTYLTSAKITMQHVEAMLEMGLMRYATLEIATLGAVMPTQLLQEEYAQKNGLRKYAVLKLPFETFLKHEQAKTVSAEELKAFFDQQNQATKRYWMPEKRAAKIWKVTPAEYGITLKDTAAQDFYEKNKVYKYVHKPSQVEVRKLVLKVQDPAQKDAVWEQAKALRQELANNPSSFADKAKELSADEATAKKGGLVAPFSKGSADPVFERKSFMLAQAQDVSEPFETAEGITIVQLVKKDPVQFKEFSSVKKEIEQELINQKFAKRFARDFKQVRNAADHNAALQSFIGNIKGQAIEQEAKAQDGSKLMRELFRLKKGNAGIYVDNNIGYIVQLTDIQKRHVPNLESIQSTVQDDLHHERARQKLQAKLKDIKQALQTSSAKQVADEFGASFTQTDFIKANDKSFGEKLKKDGLSTDLLLQLEKPGQALIAREHDGFLLTVLEVQSVDSEGQSDVKKSALAEALNERKALFLQGFIASLSRNATIETNQALSTLYEN